MKLSLYIKAMTDVLRNKGDIECVFVTTHNRYSSTPAVATVDATDKDDNPLNILAVFGYPGHASEMPPESVKNIDDYKQRAMIDATTGKRLDNYGLSIN